jgi:hypothetical protein
MAPLAALAAVATAPAVDVRFGPVQAVIRALGADAPVEDGVAGVRGAVGVLLAGVSDGAERAHVLLARVAARNVRLAGDAVCPDGAARARDDARPDTQSWRLAPDGEAGVVIGAYLRQSTAFLVTERAVVEAWRVRVGRVGPGRVDAGFTDATFLAGVGGVTGVVGGRVRGRRSLEGRIGHLAVVTDHALDGRIGGRLERGCIGHWLHGRIVSAEEPSASREGDDQHCPYDWPSHGDPRVCSIESA